MVSKIFFLSYALLLYVIALHVNECVSTGYEFLSLLVMSLSLLSLFDFGNSLFGCKILRPGKETVS